MQITFSTNASESLHAAALEQIGHLDQGTLLFFQTRKKGVERGRAGSKLTYSNDTVQVLVWTGFSYGALITRTQRKLNDLLETGTLIRTLTQACLDAGDEGANFMDTSAAIQETQAWFARVLGPEADKDSAVVGDDFKANWEPLKVNGNVVPMCKVYRGPANSSRPRSPIPGHIYVQGMKLGEKVVEASKNGAWVTARGHKTIAKDILRSWLPVGLYSQYTLDPGITAHLVAGKGAGMKARAVEMALDPEAIRQLFKIA